MGEWHPQPETLPERKTLNGKFSAYCEVCWNAVYSGWIDDEPHNGACPLGHKKATDCPDAMGRAKMTAAIRNLKKQGLVKP